MKLLIAIITLSIMFVSCNVSAEPSNQFRVPHCDPIVRNLPIFQMSVDLTTGGDKDSTVVLVGPNTWATSSHGINDGKDIKTITITLKGGIKTEVALGWFDKAKDIAVLYGNSYNIRPIDSMSFNIGDHEQVWNIGFAQMANGELMSFTGFKVRYAKNGLMVVSALGLHGMSGGATVRCVNGHLELVGIITALVHHQVNMKVWTDADGILHQKVTLVNNGISLISPMKFQSEE